ncbi:MAG: hypothetical protein EBQ51_07260 [Verrucomicrobia bacterium]|nr:hypothetical protein [Verrucomicrobiota bacterium]
MKAKVAKVKKGKGKAATGPVFIFPGPEGWEAWSTTEDGVQCVGPVESPRKLGEFPSSVVCLPSRSFLSVPIWIPVEEGIAPRELAKIALESRNLLGTNPDAAVWAMDPIRTDADPAGGAMLEGARQKKTKLVSKERPMDAGRGEVDPKEEEQGTGIRELEAVVVLVGTLEEDWLLEEAGRHELPEECCRLPGEAHRRSYGGSWDAGWSIFIRRENGFIPSHYWRRSCKGQRRRKSSPFWLRWMRREPWGP